MSAPGTAGSVREVKTHVGCWYGQGCGARLRTDHVPQHPLVGRRAHGERTDLADEGRVARLLDVAEREEPIQRVVRVGDEAVEARGGVVLGLHGAAPIRSFATKLRLAWALR